jgi:trimeric autotransporter adhesin
MPTACRRAGRRGALVVVGGSLLTTAAWGATPKDQVTPLDQKAFFRPELYISSSHVPLEDVIAQLPSRPAWEGFLLPRGENPARPQTRVYIDPRSGSASNLLTSFPVIPGDGLGNTVTLEALRTRLGVTFNAVDAQVVASAVGRFVAAHKDVLGVDPGQLGTVRASQVSSNLWQIHVPQQFAGVPVRHGRIAASISHGNIVSIGTETWGNVSVDPTPRLSAEQALAAGFAFAGGRTSEDMVRREPKLEIVPFAPPEHQDGEDFAGPVGVGYGHRLVWTFAFERPPDLARWEAMVDAQTGDVIAFEDLNQYAKKQVRGGVYPLTDTDICLNDQQCGTMQSLWPMPFADTGFPAPDNFTSSAGVYDYTGGTMATTLNGKYVRIVDRCGAVSESSPTGELDLGGVNGQHDCTTGGVSAGDTASSRSAYYEVNKLAQMARGWLPNNAWLKSQIVAKVNLLTVCNAVYDGNINFFKAGGGCRNSGEIAAVFDHEWGHGLDDFDTNGNLSNTTEAYADITAVLRLETSCIGHGFFWTSNRGCGMTADGTGFNANMAQVGATHCALDCSGVREQDWDQHADHLPDTALGFVCSQCQTGGGPCGRQVHCSAAPAAQAAWDLAKRDLPAAGFDSQSSFLIANKLFYQGSGNIGLWYACTCGGASNGCGTTNAYMQWLTADDDNGNLDDGTPHMAALFAAFDRHGIACSTPTPRDSGCPVGPRTAAVLTANPGPFRAALSWTVVPGATRYGVFRSEGHAGCNFGKTLIAEVTASTTTYVDTDVANGRTYYYNVVGAGTSAACFGPASNCANVTPAGQPPCTTCRP